MKKKKKKKRQTDRNTERERERTGALMRAYGVAGGTARDSNWDDYGKFIYEDILRGVL